VFVLCSGRKIDERKAVGLRLLCFEKVAAAVNARFERARPVST
jgi:hypothetical protein